MSDDKPINIGDRPLPAGPVAGALSTRREVRWGNRPRLSGVNMVTSASAGGVAVIPG